MHPQQRSSRHLLQNRADGLTAEVAGNDKRVPVPKLGDVGRDALGFKQKGDGLLGIGSRVARASVR